MTEGLPLHLTCWMKAEKGAEVTVKCGGTAKAFAIGTVWTRVTLDIPPLAGNNVGDAGMTFSGPKDVKVLLDTVSLTP